MCVTYFYLYIPVLSFTILYCFLYCSALLLSCSFPFPPITFSYCTSSYTTTIHVILLTIHISFVPVLSSPATPVHVLNGTTTFCSFPSIYYSTTLFLLPVCFWNVPILFLPCSTLLPVCHVVLLSLLPICSWPVPHCYQSAM